ncbi:hypothetical protein [Bremerella sp.]|uniref:hypothetical protein n=1 Tax=Bremerella sp. TaxID=2795602 RepID=UPI00391C3087
MENPYRSPREVTSRGIVETIESRLWHLVQLTVLLIVIPFAIQAVFYPGDLFERQNRVLALMLSGLVNSAVMIYGVERMNLSFWPELLTAYFFATICWAATIFAQATLPMLAEALASF